MNVQQERVWAMFSHIPNCLRIEFRLLTASGNLVAWPLPISYIPLYVSPCVTCPLWLFLEQEGWETRERAQLAAKFSDNETDGSQEIQRFSLNA